MRPLGVCFIVVTAVVHCCLLAWSIALHFPNVDEIAHLPSGVSHLKYQRFDMYRVNPPLVRSIAAVPSFILEDEYDWKQYSHDYVCYRPEFAIGRDSLIDEGLNLKARFDLPRLIGSGWSLIGAGILVVWVWRVVGMTGALVVSLLWCFSPDFLAHGPTVLPDVGMVAAYILACYGFFAYIRAPSVTSALIAGGCSGIALLTKLTMISAFAGLLVVVSILSFKTVLLSARLLGEFVRNMSICVITALLVLNAGYLFERCGTRLGDFEFCSKLLGGEGASCDSPGNRFIESPVAGLPMPIPANYLLGIDILRQEVEEKKWSFLDGEWKFGSWPHYYLMTTLYKTPEPTLIAATIGIGVFLGGWWRGLVNRELISMALLLSIPAVFCFLSVSLQGGFNHHHRYVLMIYPPMFFFASLLASPLAKQVFARSSRNMPTGPAFSEPDFPKGGLMKSSRRRPMASLARRLDWTQVVVFTLVSLSIASTLRVHPHYTTYFNTISGGPQNGWRLLGLSNIAWGQDLLFVDKWIEDHPECRPLKFELDHFGSNGRLFGLDQAWLPELPKDASIDEVRTDETQWWIVSVKKLYNYPDRNGLEYLQQLEPVDRIAYSYHVYRIDPRKPGSSGANPANHDE